MSTAREFGQSKKKQTAKGFWCRSQVLRLSMGEALDTNSYFLPEGLPVPVDDGACKHLTGTRMPSISLRSTNGRYMDVAEVSRQRAVFFFYPETGKPGNTIPVSWNDIPGARGCTPQSCSFRDHYQEFREMGFDVFGVSGQNLGEQIDFGRRNSLPYELLNDSDFRLTKALRLPTFEFQSKTFVKRLALVLERSEILKVFYPVFPPNRNADEVLRYLRSISLGQ